MTGQVAPVKKLSYILSQKKKLYMRYTRSKSREHIVMLSHLNISPTNLLQLCSWSFRFPLRTQQHTAHEVSSVLINKYTNLIQPFPSGEDNCTLLLIFNYRSTKIYTHLVNNYKLISASNDMHTLLFILKQIISKPAKIKVFLWRVAVIAILLLSWN